MSESLGTASGPSPAPRSLVLLGGIVRVDHFGAELGRSVLDLPISPDETMFSAWREHAQTLAEAIGSEPLDVSLVVNSDRTVPDGWSNDDRVRLTIERDPAEYRGTGGLLRDFVARKYDADDWILVANAAQLFLEPLPPLVERLRAAGAEVATLTQKDGTPAGLTLLRCGSLDVIPEVGYCDLKEQGLAKIAELRPVGVVTLEPTCVHPVRGLDDYVEALKALYRHRQTGPGVVSDPFAEEWQATFSVVEPESVVEEGAVLHDAVVLRGGRVERGGFAARTIVGPGGVVRAGESVIDAVVHEGGVSHPSTVVTGR